MRNRPHAGQDEVQRQRHSDHSLGFIPSEEREQIKTSTKHHLYTDLLRLAKTYGTWHENNVLLVPEACLCVCAPKQIKTQLAPQIRKQTGKM